MGIKAPYPPSPYPPKGPYDTVVVGLQESKTKGLRLRALGCRAV